VLWLRITERYRFQASIHITKDEIFVVQWQEVAAALGDMAL